MRMPYPTPKTRPKWKAVYEKFCLAVVAGTPPQTAYIECGFAKRSATTNAFKFLHRPEIQKRIRELQKLYAEKVIEKNLITKEWVMEQLRLNYHKAMQHEPVLDKKGNPIGVYVYNGAVANRALELMGKELSMFKVIIGGDPNAPLKLESNIKVSVYIPENKRNDAA